MASACPLRAAPSRRSSTRAPARPTRSRPSRVPRRSTRRWRRPPGPFPAWRDATPSRRSLALLRVADSLESHAEELVATESRNTAKPVALTLSEEIPPPVDQIRFFAGAAGLLEGRSAGEYLSGFTSYVRREPIGVCAAVTSWNYPMMLAVWKWAPALAAGNMMVLKPSDTTPASSSPTRRRPWWPSPGAFGTATSTPARTARLRRGCSRARACTTTSSPRSSPRSSRCSPAARQSAPGATAWPRRWWRACARTTRWSRRRSSGRSSRSSVSRTRTRPSPGRTGSATGSPRASGRGTTAARCGSRGRSTSAASGSIPTSRSWRRCPTGASSGPATARTSAYGLEDYTRVKHVMHVLEG